MNIQKLKVSDLIPYENNPRKNDEAVKYIANSIKEFGFKVPIIVDKNNVIVAGHTRLKALKKLGIKEVDCVIADDLTDEQIRALRLADNKAGEMAEWDLGKLNFELDNIELDMSEFGFDLDTDTDKEIEREDLSNKVQFENKIEVTCKDENETEVLYNEFIERGLECKIL